jgi:ankyrin repeat protein
VVARLLVPVFEGVSVTVGSLLNRQVGMLRDAHRRRDPVAAELLRGTDVVVSPAKDTPTADLSLDTAQLAIARDHRYEDWAAAAEHGDDPVDLRFEAAADAIQWGELETLRSLLGGAPALVRMRSPFPHGATLLHHVAANGIEVERQLQSPPNAVEIMRLLLERGAEPDAVCAIYGERDTTMVLLVSSSIPATAGVQAALVEELCHGGARADGVDDDGAPLWTAITFGYTEAAEALVRCGARVDNVVFAAALGDLDGVRSYVDPSGRLTPGRTRSAARIGAEGSRLRAERVLEYAIIWAALHGRRDVVELLLHHEPDLGYAEPFFGATAVGAARYNGDAELAELLEAVAPRD